LEAGLEGYQLPKVLLGSTALAPSSPTRSFDIHASYNILTRDGTHPVEFRKLASEQISSYHNNDFVDTEITTALHLQIQ
jgi:hypothetical protein